MDFLESCRICRTHCTTSNSEHLTTSINDIEIREILTQTIPIDFNDEISQKLPQKICFGCFETFLSAYELQKIAIESNEMFRAMIACEEIPIEIKSENLESLIEIKAVSMESDVLDVSEKPPPAKKSRKQNLQVKQDVDMTVKICNEDKNFDSDSTGSSEINSTETHDKIPTGSNSNRNKHQSGFSSDSDFHLEEILQKCEICDEKFKNKKYDEHFMTVHERLIRPLKQSEIKFHLKCCKCERAFNSLEIFNEHTQIHNQNYQPFKCKFHGREIKTFKAFKFHLKMVNPITTHKCLTCDENFTFDYKLIDHVRGHLNRKEAIIQCPECKVKSRSRTDFKYHYKRHKDEGRLICQICGLNLANNQSLKHHIRLVHNRDTAEKFPCKYCDKTFIRKPALMSHLAIHSTNRPYVCDQCGFATKKLEGLKIHIQRHAGTIRRDHACGTCGKTHMQKEKLEIHMRSHTGQKPEQCQYCDRAYADPAALRKHVKKTHFNDLMYKCEKCSKAFRRIMELREHLGEHENDV